MINCTYLMYDIHELEQLYVFDPWSTQTWLAAHLWLTAWCTQAWLKEMTFHFLNRGYPIDLLKQAALKARRLDRNLLLHPFPRQDKQKLDRSILTTTFHPFDSSLKDLVNKNWDLLGKSHTTLQIHNRNQWWPTGDHPIRLIF